MNENTLALVTGSSVGIGQACATHLLARGWRVIGYSRRESSIKHAQYTHVQLDLSDLKSVEAHFSLDKPNPFYQGSPARVGLVNNAALLAPVGALENAQLSDLEQCYRVNVLTPLWLSYHWLPKAFPKAALRIVDVSSGAASHAVSGWGAYCSSKAALLMAARVWGEDYAQGLIKHDNMTVTSYSPGVVDTDMQALIRSQTPQNFPSHQRFLELHQQGKLASPDVPARQIATLLEEDAKQAYQETARN